MSNDSKKVLLDVQINITEAIKNLSATKSQIESLKEAQKALGKVTDENRAEYEAYGAQIRQLNNLARQQQKEIDNTIKAQKSEEGSTEQLRAQLSILTEQYNSLSRAQKKSAEGKELAKTIKDIGSEVKSSNEDLGNFRDSIGDYENKIKSALGLQDGFIGNLANMATGANEAGESFGKQLSGGVKSAGKAFLSLLTNPIILILAAIVGGVMLLVKAFQRNEESGNKLNAAFARLSSVFNLLLKALEPVADFLVNVLIKSFEMLEKVAGGTLSLLSTGLEKLGFENASNGINKFKDSLSESANESERLAKMEAELRNEQRKSERVQLDYQRRAEKLRQLRDDESKSIPERIKANRELGAILQKQMNAELAIAKKALDVANLRIKLEGATTENLDAQAEALNKISDIQERITGQQSEQLQNENSLRKEAAAKRKEIAQKIAKAELDIENLKSQTIIDKQNEIANNEKLSYQQRLDALSKSETEQIKIIERNRDAELKQEGLTSKERQAIRAKANAEIIKLKDNTEKTITDIEAKELDKRLKLEAENLTKKKQQIANDQQDELVKLSENFAKGIISATEYEKEKIRIAQKYREDDFNASLSAFAAQLNLENLSADQRKEIERQIAETKNKYAQESAQIAIQANEKIVENEKQAAEKRKEIEQQLSDKKKELFSQLITTIQDITNGQFNFQSQKIDEETQKVADSYDERINAAKTAKKDTTKLEDEKTKALEEQEAKKRKLVREQAIIERAFAAFNIGVSTAKSVGDISLKTAEITAAAALNPLLIPSIAISSSQIPVAIGIGALQLASVMAQPLPKAARGKVFRGRSHAQGGIPVEVEGDEIILTKGVYRNPALRSIASAINQAAGGIRFDAGGITPTYKFQDGGYAGRYYSSTSTITKDDIEKAMEKAVSKIKVITTIEDIRKADDNYTNIKDRADF